MKTSMRAAARAAALVTLTALVTILPTAPASAGTSACVATTVIGTKNTTSVTTLSHDVPSVYAGDPVRTVTVSTRSAISHTETDQAYSLLDARSVKGHSDITVVAGAVSHPVHITLDAAPVAKGVDVQLTGRGTFPFTPPATPQVVQLKTPTASYNANTTFYKSTDGTGAVATEVNAVCSPQAEDNFATIAVRSRSTTVLDPVPGPVTAGALRQVPVAVSVDSGTVAGRARLVVDGVEKAFRTLTNGRATLTLEGLSEGRHTVAAEFVPNDTVLYDGSRSAPQTIDVLPPAIATTTTLTLSRTSAAATETVTATARVAAATGAPVGTVEFAVDGNVVATRDWTAADPAVTAPLSGLAPGVHDVVARFTAGNPLHFTPSESDAATLVVRAPSTLTTTAVTVSKNPATTSDVLTAVATVTARAGTAQGTVQFLVDGSPVGGPTTVTGTKATRVLGRVALPGAHAVTAEFTPANVADFEPSTSAPFELTITAPGEATATRLALSRLSGTSADPVTATVTVSSDAGIPAGRVRLSDNGTQVAEVEATQGTATIAVPALDDGVHSLVATFVPADANRFRTSASAAQVVTVTAVTSVTELALTPDTTSAGRDVRVDATVRVSAGIPEGAVEVLVAGAVLASAPVRADGSASVVLPALPEGGYDVVARFAPQRPRQQRPSSSQPARLTLTVPLVATQTTTTATMVDPVVTTRDRAQVRVVVAADGSRPPGEALIEVDGHTASAPLVGGAAEIVLPELVIGTHDIVVQYVPANAALFAGSRSPGHVLRVVPAAVATTTLLSVTPETVASGESVTATASVTAARGEPAGAVLFTVDGVTRQPAVPLDGLAATLVLPQLAEGPHRVDAEFVPQDRLVHAASTAPTQRLEVQAPDRDATTAGLVLSPSRVDSGEVALAIVTVAGARGRPHGTVTVTVDGEELAGEVVDGVAKIALPAYLPVGSVPVAAAFTPAPGASYAASAAPTRTLTVVQAAAGSGLTRTELSLSPSRPAVGETVTATAWVSWLGGAPAGSVRFTIDGTPVGEPVPVEAGVAAVTLPARPQGSYLVGASFVPDDSGTMSSAAEPLVMRVAAADAVVTMTRVVLGATRLLRGGSTAATVRVSAEGAVPQGSVEVSVDGTVTTLPLADGEAVLPIEAAAVGEYVVSAVFMPADPTAFAASGSRHATLVVSEPPAAARALDTQTSLRLGAETVTVGELVSATVTVSAPGASRTPTGVVTLAAGGTVFRSPLTDGAATVSLPPLAAGTHEVEVTYEPDVASFAASRAAVATLEVAEPRPPAMSPAPPAPSGPAVAAAPPAPATGTTTTLSVVRPVVPLGGQVELRAVVDGGSRSGSVRFSSGGTLVTAPVVDGTAVAVLPATAMGVSSITATFVPADAASAPSWAAGTVSVGKAATTATLTGRFTRRRNQVDVLCALAAGALAAPGGRLRLSVEADGRKVLAVSLPVPASGQVRRNFNRLPPAASYRITATYAGSATTEAVTAAATVKGAGRRRR